MIVDTSAFLSIFFQEPDATQFSEAINACEHAPLFSVASYLEAVHRIDRAGDKEMSDRLDSLVGLLRLSLEPVTVDQIRLARHAFQRFGRAPARLNFGDCFVYALAKATGRPLLYKGGDFGHTDIVPALAG